MELTASEENYIKAIYSLYAETKAPIATNDLADKMETKASSATDMIKRLSEKNIINYVKYKGCELTKEGELIALKTIRKHRLWETFLVDKLNFKWDEVHEIAEQLEHIKSKKLTDRLEQFLDFPKFDPHGDPIPDEDGKMTKREKTLKLIDCNPGMQVTVIGVDDGSSEFFSYLENFKIQLGTHLVIQSLFDFDKSIQVLINDKVEAQLSKEATSRITVQIKSK